MNKYGNMGTMSSGSVMFSLDMLSNYVNENVIETNQSKQMTPFEIKVTIPIRKANVFENNYGCSTQEIGIVSVEHAKQIRDAINRQLRGLSATQPKKTKPTKKRK